MQKRKMGALVALAAVLASLWLVTAASATSEVFWPGDVATGAARIGHLHTLTQVSTRNLQEAGNTCPGVQDANHVLVNLKCGNQGDQVVTQLSLCGCNIRYGYAEPSYSFKWRAREDF